MLALTSNLSKRGINQVRIGQELEFSLPEKAIDGLSRWQDIKTAIINELQSKIIEADDLDRSKLKKKLAEVKKFNAREVLMYDMIELDDRTKELLESLFGRTRDGNGYYDGQMCLELKLNHCPIEEYSQRHQTVLHVLIEKAIGYGLPLNSPPSSHLSFSFWDEHGNIMQSSHPDYGTKGKIITEGVTRALYDALPVIMDSYTMSQKFDKDTALKFTTNREGLLRAATGRYEVRPNLIDIKQHTDLIILPVLAGALYALKNQDSADYAREFKQAHFVGSGSFAKPKNVLKVFTHVLSNSEINPDGSLTVPKYYIQSKADYLAFNLGLIDEEPKPSHLDALRGRQDYDDSILEFIQRIKINLTGDKPKIIFPTNCLGGYYFKTDEINLDRIPSHVADKIRKGADPRKIHREWDNYIVPGDRIPKAAVEYTIDTEALAKKIKIRKVESRLVITDGYDLNQSQAFGDYRDLNPGLYSKIERMKHSTLLRDVLSPEFHKELTHAIETAIPKPVTVEAVPQERKEEIKALLKAALETQLTEKLGAQSINLYKVKYRSSKHADEFKVEVTAALTDIVGIEHAEAISKQMSTSQAHIDHLGDQLTLSYNLIKSVLPRIEANPTRVADYKKLMSRDIVQEMRDIAASRKRR